MRDPNSMPNIYELDTPPSIIQIDDIPPYTISDYDLNDDKSFKKYIFAIEKSVRTSFEYRAFTQFLREYMDMHQCAFYKNVNNVDTTKIHIEIHHEPLTLYDICLIIYNKRVAYGESLQEELVAKEVSYLHYNLMVGLIPLAKTVHQLVGAKYLFVPTTAVFGKYKEFVELYKDYMLPEQLENLENIEAATLVYDNDDAKTLLSTNFIYVDVTGAYDLPKTEDVIALLKGRIDDILKEN